jgi:hypothetical protein
MTKIYFLLSFISASLTAPYTTQAQNFTDPAAYLGYVGEQFSAISNDMMSYTSAASHGKSARKVEKKRAELMETIKTAELNMRKLKPFEGDASLKDSVASYFRLNRLVLNEDYSKIVNMEEVAEQSYDKMEAYMLAKEKATKKLEDAYQVADQQYKAFADKNKIRLIEQSSKLSKKLEQTNKVMTYYNTIYLIFFKSYKDEVYLLDAYNKGNVSAIEQTKNSLQTSSSEGLKKMSPISALELDKSLKDACEKMLGFYTYEASDKTNELTDYYLKKEKFEKAKKAVDAKKDRDRTQSDVDNFNKLVNEFNESVNKFNKLNGDLNKRRSEALANWNKVSSDFLDEHIPKHN